MNNTTKQQENKNKDLKPAIEMPVMTEDEMKKFISTVSNTESIQGDYVFNGFLFFFQSVYELIKANPVEAQNRMFHLQQHIFNNLMWESFHAFDAHRKKAHLIFGKSEPFISYEKADEAEQVLDLSNSSVESLAQSLSQLMHNPNLPTSVYNCLADEFAEIDVDTNSPENILKNLKKAGEK